jgi:hypothetical protein
VKFKTRTEHYTEPHTVDGITVPVTRTRTVSTPLLPRDWDRAALRTTTALVMVLTVVAVAWSTVSIGNVLGGGVGYLAASVFDVAWATCLLLEWMARFSPDKRAFPRRLGWLLLVLTMGAIFWNGMLAHSVAMAVVGAVVSFVAKVLWLGVTKHVDKELSDPDAQWVAAQISAANAKMAVAQVRRQAARIEHQAAAELLAMEAETGPTMQLLATRQEPAAAVEAGPSPTVRSAVRAAFATMPDATADDIVEQLARVGVDVTADTVRDLSGTGAQHGDAGDAHHDAPLVGAGHPGGGDIAKSTAILDAASTLGGDAGAARIVDLVRRRHRLDVEPNYVRAVLSREAKKNGGYL